MSEKKLWRENLIGPEKDLRDIFEKLLQECLNMNSGASSIPTNTIKLDFISNEREGRLFTNLYNPAIKTKTFFTKTNLGNFLEATFRFGNMEKAVQVIQKSDLYIEKKKVNCDFKKIIQCEKLTENSVKDTKYHECMDNIINGKPFAESCSNCPIKWIYDTLQNIENNYWEIVLSSKKVPLDYSNLKDKKLVAKIYNDINQFESDFSKIGFHEDNAFEIFSLCNRCWDIENVADEKLAYVKWYTAHLYTWPFFKSKLISAGLYNENVVFSYLESASRILKTLKNPDADFTGRVESEKIVSYLSLAYINPFATEYCDTYEEIALACEKVLRLNISESTKLALKIELWNLSVHTHKILKAESLQKEINTLLTKNNTEIEWLELKARFYAYLYLYEMDDKKCIPTNTNEISKLLRNKNAYRDTMDIMTELIFKKYWVQKFTSSDNPLLMRKFLIGIEPFDKIPPKKPISPNKYNRVYGDNSIDEYFRNYRL